ncbi:MAG: hypothetical protein HXX17_10105 [Geobacteraceae bacterium]|nr:hypothetical protein [Geobacteraceae bacterium]
MDKITNMLNQFQKLSDLIYEADISQKLTANDIAALERDRKFIDFATVSLASKNPDTINELWRQVQCLSHFFGGDYIKYYRPVKFNSLMEEIFDQMLETVAEIRKSRGNIVD